MNSCTLPEALTSLDRWVCWVGYQGRKPPMVPDAESRRFADITQPAHWASYAQAKAAQAAHRYAGVGFVFTGDGLVGVDIDNCVFLGKLNQLAWNVVRTLNSYTEISPSRTGLKLWVYADLGDFRGLAAGGVEVYARDRYFTVTGLHLAGTPTTINRCTADMQHLIAWMQERIPAAAPVAPQPAGGGLAYAEVALDRECGKVRSAPAGERNNMLYRAAFAMGTLIGGGALEEISVTERLLDAGTAAGLGQAECRLTIRSGLRAGMQKPRRVEAARKPD